MFFLWPCSFQTLCSYIYWKVVKIKWDWSDNLNFVHFRKYKNCENVNQKMGRSLDSMLQLLLSILLVKFCDNCKYPNLNMKFDIRKIVERKLNIKHTSIWCNVLSFLKANFWFRIRIQTNGNIQTWQSHYLPREICASLERHLSTVSPSIILSGPWVCLLVLFWLCFSTDVH